MLAEKKHFDLSIVIPALHEAENLAELLPQIKSVLAPLNLNIEIIVVDEIPDAETEAVVGSNACVLISPPIRGYAAALISGLRYASSDCIITMDADLSHPPHFLRDLWSSRNSADIIIASRYILGGHCTMPKVRYCLSKLLNMVFSRGLDLGVRDMSSGFRLYHRRVLDLEAIECQHFDILQELLTRGLVEGFSVREIPFDYQPRLHGASQARVIRFGLAYLKTFGRLWVLRNSIASADYDARAYNSWLIIQRYWQRQRCKHVIELSSSNTSCIDIGCGSSRILEKLPPGSVALDIQIRKLRYARRFQSQLIQGSALALPVQDQSFACLICSQVIEHIAGKDILNELDRVLEPGGLLILGTPDYGKWQWRVTEWFYARLLPQAYADEHITHYTYQELIYEMVERRKYSLVDQRYILQGELILAIRKPEV